jgi:hypothetical protein
MARNDIRSKIATCEHPNDPHIGSFARKIDDQIFVYTDLGNGVYIISTISTDVEMERDVVAVSNKDFEKMTDVIMVFEK